MERIDSQSITIILNGHSSSGKSTLMDEIAKLSNELFLRMGIDLVWAQLLSPQYIMFNEKSHLGLNLVKTNLGIKTIIGKYGKELIELLIQSVKLFQDRNFNILFNDVILDSFDLEKFKILDIKKTFFIGVYLEKARALEYERSRGDRPIGLVEGQYDVIHQFEEFYDLKVDAAIDFKENAKTILDFVAKNSPFGLQNYFNS